MINFTQFLSEARMAPLYHAAPANSVESIISNNKIQARTWHRHDRHVNRENFKEVVSLTRSLPFAMRWGERKAYSTGYAIFELDQQKLAQNYKIVPYNHFQDMEHLGSEDIPMTRQLNDVRKYSWTKFPINQYEENVIGDIKNLKNYIIRIHYVKGDLSSLVKNYLKEKGFEVTDKYTSKYKI